MLESTLGVPVVSDSTRQHQPTSYAATAAATAASQFYRNCEVGTYIMVS